MFCGFLNFLLYARHYQQFNGARISGLFWMLVVVLLALVAIFWTKMFLPCHLHQRMNMKLRYSLLWSEEFLQLFLSLEHKSWLFLIMGLIWSIVHDAGFIGMQTVLAFLIIFISGQPSIISFNVPFLWIFKQIWFTSLGGKPLYELNRILRPGGFFAWSATPVYRDDERDQKVWNGLSFSPSQSHSLCVCLYMSFSLLSLHSKVF